MKQHLNIRVEGKVQGVFFRASTKAVADQLGVTGYVCNKQDGSVYIEAEAEPVMLEQFLDWCHKGPDRAEVKKVETSEGPLQQFINFIVKKDR
jgi:acylphosphatase